MQRSFPEGIIIACDFCGTDWDQVLPMIEGHHGSVLCLSCLQAAITQITPSTQTHTCTLCQRSKPTATPGWKPSAAAPSANPLAWACHPCLIQAAQAFSKDPDIPWQYQP